MRNLLHNYLLILAGKAFNQGNFKKAIHKLTVLDQEMRLYPVRVQDNPTKK